MWLFYWIFFIIVIIVEATRPIFFRLPCPSKCVCFRRTTRCNQLGLTDIPNVALHTDLLNLGHNNIKNIVPGTFKNHQFLQSLFLNNNLLTSLMYGYFTGLHQLRHLYLSKNRIKYLEPDVFQGLPKLEHLYLHNNQLEEIGGGAFSNIPRLDRLFLYNNYIRYIPTGAFQNLRKLTRLRLDLNPVVANCQYPDEIRGNFRCRAPEIMEGPQDVEISWGSSSVFRCKVISYPIDWMRNLHYECVAKSAHEEAKLQPGRTVFPFEHSTIPYGLPRRPPKFVYKPYNMEVLAGSTVELPCKAEGDPTPFIQWRKDGAALRGKGRTKISLTGTLYIYDVLPDEHGLYECIATNDFGRDSASCYLTVRNNRNPTNTIIGDVLVKTAFLKASQEVDGAINRTIDNLFNNKKPHSFADLMQLILYPSATAREMARSAEIYERTLENIREHVQKELIVKNCTSDFKYREILSPDHLHLVAELARCVTHKSSKNCTDRSFYSKYRSIDGSCNNLQHPMWGASLTGFRRILKPIYENGFDKPIGWDKDRKYYGFSKPSSRLVSSTLIATNEVTPDPETTHMHMQWGQFIVHDFTHALPSVSTESWNGINCRKTCEYAAPCYPMDVPPDDPRVTNRSCIDFTRTSAVCESGMTSVFSDSILPREQINQLTSYIDASQIYGFSEELAKDLRNLTGDAGLLREGAVFPGRKPLLPYAENHQGVDCRRNFSESTINCFVAGDIRANEQVSLTALHTLWMREHNRVARELNVLNPHWGGDTVYHEARKIVSSAVQHITYKHWLPFIVGEEGMKMLGKYQGYNPTIDPRISNVFATAAFRFGHTNINGVFHRLGWDFKPINEGNLLLRDAFFSPWRVVEEGGIDPILRGLFAVPSKLKKPDQNIHTELTEQLFKAAHIVALDLGSMNIHRARDHGIPGYLEFRKFCNMTQVNSFGDLRNVITDKLVLDKLEKLYGHPGNIDVFVGGVLEDQIDGARVGPLFHCLIIEQFKRVRDGDRFYYENPSVFKPEQLAQIKNYSLSRVLCDNGDNITRVSPNVFLLPELQGAYHQCKNIPKVDLSLWAE